MQDEFGRLAYADPLDRLSTASILERHLEQTTRLAIDVAPWHHSGTSTHQSVVLHAHVHVHVYMYYMYPARLDPPCST